MWNIPFSKLDSGESVMEVFLKLESIRARKSLRDHLVQVFTLYKVNHSGDVHIELFH